MPVYQSGVMRYATFESFERYGVIHACIGRQGGVSPQPWASLNVGGTVGDNAERVLENRHRSFSLLRRSLESMYDVWQVHGCEIVCAEGPRPAQTPHLRADAILTDQEGVTLFMRFADCVPIFLFDPRRKVVGLAHAGWQGSIKRVAALAVQRMQAHYGSRPEDILAGIGPSIGAHHYPVGAEVAAQVQQAFAQEAGQLLTARNGGAGLSGVQFDLWSANRLVLEQAGVQKVELSGICTACHVEDWYSHRGEAGRTGRFGALIAL